MTLTEQVQQKLKTLLGKDNTGPGSPTYRELERQTGLSGSHINRVLNAKKGVSLETIESIAASRNCDVDIEFRQKK